MNRIAAIWHRMTSSQAAILALGALIAGLWLASILPSGSAVSLFWPAVVATRFWASFALAGRAFAPGGPSRVISWRFVAVAFSLWAVADLFAFAGVLRLPFFPLLSLAFWLRLAGYLAAIVGFGSHTAARGERFGRYRSLMDVAIIAVGVFTLAWLVLVRPVLEIGLAQDASHLEPVFSPVLSILLLTLLLRIVLLAKGGAQTLITTSLAVAMLAHLFSDFAYAYQNLTGDEISVGFMTLGWIAANVAFALAPSRGGLVWDTQPLAGTRPARRSLRLRLEPLLPITLTCVALGSTVAEWLLAREIDWAAVAGGGVLILLLFARQGVIAGQMEMRQFQALVDASADMAFICQGDGRIRLANPSLYEALGWTPNHAGLLLFPDMMALSQDSGAILGQAVQTGWSGEVDFRREDGSRLPVALSLRPVRDERHPSPILVGAAHDLTGVRQREQEIRSALEQVASARNELAQLNQALEARVLERTQELQEVVANLARLNEELKVLDKLKTEFVALVSHELRAPLTNICTGIELILQSGQDLSPATLQALGLVRTETERLRDFVEAILSLSALEAGRYPIELSPLSVAEVMESLSGRLPEHSGWDRLRVNLPASLPAVMADERALNSVLFHLIDNAMKYAPQGPVEIGGKEHGDEVEIWVRDAGPGIPIEERERVFEMFHRLDGRDSREVYGHGLGLFLVRRLLQAMGGNIHIEEAASGGARFVFRLRRSVGVSQRAQA